MIWLTLFLLGTFSAVICGAVALVLWLGVATLGGFLTSVQRSLTGLSDGHLITGLLYLVPAGFFLYAIGEGLYLAYSFITTVFLR